MSYEKLELLIGGEFRQGSEGKTEAVINPATEEVIGEVPHASAADLDLALQASVAGFKEWKQRTPLQRQAVMEKAARLMEDRIDSIARTLTLEIGKPLAESKVEMQFVIDVTRWYGEEGKRTYGRLVPSRTPGTRQMVTKEPVGPTVAFVAWNFPGTNVIRKVAGALAAGCSIVIKPSEETPGTAVAIARCFQDAGLPAGVLNVVFGSPDAVSRHLLGSWIPRKVSFTGSVPVGKHLLKLSADTVKRATMELGGHAPVIVFDDADVNRAITMMSAFKYRNAGQVCISPTRFFVQDGVYKDFVEGFTERAKALKVGNGLEDGVQMGPVIAARRLEVMESFVADARKHGATVTAGGERIGNRGFFYAPTVIKDVPNEAKIMSEEPFGPLAPITHFNTFDEVVERANSLPFGLSSYVFTSDGGKASRISDALETGLVGVNTPFVSTPETPFGGVNESGYGSEGGIEGLEAFLRTKFVVESGV
ncbi:MULTISPECIES: NAD-dependent succinate-semialdehyde dehydrogenase [Rhodomicrobium]|uniref:NAD-dependent succinate-semialdehyde dehydrogenase n=1 Tax=Rhodomicrobium TaxID=1068 RepID=UPI000B4BA7E6|nr:MULTISPECIES: NAD-dependent succinate-semialdehyde dehydrogenase [Rhodomicrobium]